MTELPKTEGGFWMVSRLPQKGEEWVNPKKRHKSYDIARKEADRLAEKFQQPFVILQTVEIVKPVAISAEEAA